jgi:hypothetical protein
VRDAGGDFPGREKAREVWMRIGQHRVQTLVIGALAAFFVATPAVAEDGAADVARTWEQARVFLPGSAVPLKPADVPAMGRPLPKGLAHERETFLARPQAFAASILEMCRVYIGRCKALGRALDSTLLTPIMDKLKQMERN